MEEPGTSGQSGANVTQPTVDIKASEDHFLKTLRGLLEPEIISKMRQDAPAFENLMRDYQKNPFLTLLRLQVWEDAAYACDLHMYLLTINHRFEYIAKNTAYAEGAFLNHVEEWKTFVNPHIAQHYLKATVQQQIELSEDSISSDERNYIQRQHENFILFSRSVLEFYQSRDLDKLGLSPELTSMMPAEVDDLHKALSGLFLKPVNLEAALIKLEPDVVQETLSPLKVWHLNFQMVRSTLFKLHTRERSDPLVILRDIQESDEEILSDIKQTACLFWRKDLQVLSKVPDVSVDWYLRALAATYAPMAVYAELVGQCLYVITEESCFKTLSVKLGGYDNLLHSLFDSASGTLGLRTVVRLATEYFESRVTKEEVA